VQRKTSGPVLRFGAGLLILLVAAFPVAAQTTGKLAGTVTDASTGERLPGVNVVIAGTVPPTTTAIITS
jgi:iron complex outermembrane recepter protein